MILCAASRSSRSTLLRRYAAARMLLSAFFAVLFAMVPVLPAAAESRIDSAFRTWLDADLWPDASRAGVSRKTFDAAFAGVMPNLKLPDLVLPGQKPSTPQDQHQAEFRSPGAYFAPKTIGAVISGGRARIGTQKSALAEAQRKYGVPPGIVLEIWGRESGFGAAKIPNDAIEVLATKAFLSTRKEMFRKEIVAALVMLEKGLAVRAQLKSSWAGALGQPQFLPTSFLKHAVDGDGDSRRDIWNSQADTIASIAKYLHDYGWIAGRDWGFEVIVPEDVSCSLEGPDKGKPIAAWAALGIARANGRPFPASELKAEGYLLMPAGRHGPAFVVTPNFYVLKEYNESDLYALFVGHAADRIAGGDREFAGEWGAVGGLKRSDIASLQRALEGKGYDVGGADGLPGFKTRRSIGAWQGKQGRAATCFPDAAIVSAVR